MSRVILFTRIVSIAGLVGLAGCATAPQAEQSAQVMDAYQAAIEAASRPASPEEILAAERSDPLTRASFWAEEYRKDSSNIETAVAFMRALRSIGSHDRVVEIAVATAPIHPHSYELFLELGRSKLANKQPEEAAQAFVRAADLAPPNEAAPLAALGVAFDRSENHSKAQQAYKLALERDPDRVSTLSNYGLSLALSGDLNGAEMQLQRAISLPGADMRVRQNLALVLGLQGRFDEMMAIDPNAPQLTVEANQRALRAMMIPQRRNDSSEPGRATEAETAMPVVDEALMTSDAMPAPVETDPDTLSGATPEPRVVLRPKLRGAQSG